MIQDWRDPAFYLKDEDFIARMEEEAVPFFRENVKEGNFTSYDGTQIHYYYLVNPDEKAAVMISHGFCEFFGKLHEIIWNMYRAGYSVFFMEHRGHGHSQRFTDDLDKVHLNKGFEEYVKDLKAYYDQIVSQKSLTCRYFLFAHSMGGAIGAMFLEKYPNLMEKAVLSSPMIRANYGSIPEAVVKALAITGNILGWGEKWAPGQHGYSTEDHFTDSCSDSRSRFTYVQQLRMQDSLCRNSGGTYGWSRGAVNAAGYIKKNLKKVKTPVLLFQAGRDTLVMPDAQDAFVAGTPHTTKIVFPDAKHEIFNSSDENIRKFYMDIFAFFEG